MQPVISIVIPVYNREDYLKFAIESVLRQTFNDFELIIWDDGSTDKSVEIASQYAKQDKRVKVIAARHQGFSISLKAAFSICSGKYVGWIDSDDIIAPTTLVETVKILEDNPEIGLVYTDYLLIDKDNKILGKGTRCQIPYSKDRLLVDFMTFHFRLMRKEVFEQAGGINEISGPVPDYDLCLRLSEITEIYHLKQPLYYYRKHSDNMSDNERIELIYSSQNAIARALQRRGLDKNYEINVEIIGKFYLEKKRIGNEQCNG